MPLGEALQKCYDLRCILVSGSDPRCRRFVAWAPLIWVHGGRSPKPELLHLLLEHMPRPHNGKHAVNGTNGHAAPGLGAHSRKARELPEVRPVLLACCMVPMVAADVSAGMQAVRHLADVDDGVLAAYLEPRHVLDIVQDFAGARPPLEEARPPLACLLSAHGLFQALLCQHALLMKPCALSSCVRVRSV